MVIEVIQREALTRGMGYIILRDCPEERLGEALGKGMEKLKKAGAATVWATSLPEGEPLHPGPVGVWRLTHTQDTLELTRDLTQGRAKPDIKLNIRQPKRAQEDSALMDLINRGYGDVTGAVSLRSTALRLPNHRYGLAYQGDQPVAAYILDLNEKIPELTHLAVDPALRRQGLGRAVLRSALDSLGRAPACRVEVASSNAAARALLAAEGFTQSGVAAEWFEVV